MHPGIIGAIIGGVCGIAGGLIGTYFSVKNTSGPQERKFMIQASAITWIGVLLFLVLMFALPSPFRYLLWIPYGIVLFLAIAAGNRIQRRIRQQELQ